MNITVNLIDLISYVQCIKSITIDIGTIIPTTITNVHVHVIYTPPS